MRSRVTPAGAWSRSSSASFRLTESARRLPTRTATRVSDMGSPLEWEWMDSGLKRTAVRFYSDPAVRRNGLDHWRCASTVACTHDRTRDRTMTEPATDPMAEPMTERPLLPLL